MHLKCQRDAALIQLIPPNSKKDVRKEESLYSSAPYVSASLMKPSSTSVCEI